MFDDMPLAANAAIDLLANFGADFLVALELQRHRAVHGSGPHFWLHIRNSSRKHIAGNRTRGSHGAAQNGIHCFVLWKQCMPAKRGFFECRDGKCANPSQINGRVQARGSRKWMQ